jgi:ABC-type branched-subunit amino acid transport system substrate-binding protein
MHHPHHHLRVVLLATTMALCSGMVPGPVTAQPADDPWQPLYEAVLTPGDPQAMRLLLEAMRRQPPTAGQILELMRALATQDGPALQRLLAQQPAQSAQSPLTPFLQLALGDLLALEGEHGQAVELWQRVTRTAQAPSSIIAEAKLRLGATPPHPESAHTLAIFLPLSGPNAVLGHNLLHAAQTALSAYPDVQLVLEVIDENRMEDANGNRLTADQRVAQLAEQKIQGILGPVFREPATAVAAAARQHRLPIITFNPRRDVVPATPDHSVGEPLSPVLLNAFDTEQQGILMARFAALQRQNIKRIAIVAPASDYGRTMARVFADEAAHLGSRITHQSFIDEKLVDFSAILKGITANASPAKGPAVDGMFLPLQAAQARNFIAQAAGFGLYPSSVLMMGSAQWNKPELTRDGTDFLQGVVFCATEEATRATAFKNRFQALWDTPPAPIAPLAYDGIAIVAQALREQRLGGPAWSTVLLRDEGFRSITGRVGFQPDGSAWHDHPLLTVSGTGIAPFDPAAAVQPAPSVTSTPALPAKATPLPAPSDTLEEELPRVPVTR